MSYTALVVQILLSSPSDLPVEHHGIVTRAVRRWNSTHGRIYGINYSPTDWQEGGSSGFGEYAQAVLNEQIVEDSDMGLVIFTDRLGTPTPNFPSGTAEEIDLLLKAGKEVAIIMNETQRSPSGRPDSGEQRTALDAYIKQQQAKAFMSSYDSEARLTEIVEQILTRLAVKYRNDSRPSAEASAPDESRPSSSGNVLSYLSTADLPSIDDIEQGIWPRIEVSESQKTDSKGRLKSSKNWKLVLYSTLNYAARNVRFVYLDKDRNIDQTFDVVGSSRDMEPIGVFPPRGEVSFPLYLTFGSSTQALCVVEWEDQKGQVHSSEATVRTM